MSNTTVILDSRACRNLQKDFHKDFDYVKFTEFINERWPQADAFVTTLTSDTHKYRSFKRFLKNATYSVLEFNCSPQDYVLTSSLKIFSLSDEIQRVVLVTGFSAFIPLAQALVEKGKLVEVVFFEKFLSKKFLSTVSAVYLLDENVYLKAGTNEVISRSKEA